MSAPSVVVRTLASYASACGPVARVRIAAGVSGREMAECLGVASSTLAAYECGKRPMTDARLRVWATKCGVATRKARGLFDKAHADKEGR